MPAIPEAFWGKPSASVDWCETNYEISPFIAEFWNSMSSLGVIIPPILGIYEIVWQGLEKKYITIMGTIIAIGVGSFVSHLTLLFSMQLMEEIPMILSNSVLIYHLSEVRKSAKREVNWTLVILMAAYFVLYCGLYFALKNPAVHQVMYGLGALVVLSLDLRLVKYNQCRSCTKLLSAGFFLYTFGFGLWNIDSQLCQPISEMRKKLPSSLKPLTQLHALSHLLAGYAMYLHALFVIHARGHFFKPRIKIGLRWFGISVKPTYRVD